MDKILVRRMLNQQAINTITHMIVTGEGDLHINGIVCESTKLEDILYKQVGSCAIRDRENRVICEGCIVRNCYLDEPYTFIDFY